MRRAIFFDRDGTLLVEFGYLTHPTQVVPYPQSREAIRRARAHGYLAIVVTNQSGIARAYLGERHLAEIHDRMLGLFCGDAAIDAVYYCPHHPEGTVAEFSKPCTCRKPGPELGRLAAERFGIDLGKSYVVGDKLTDVDFGRALGARPCLVRTGFGRREEARAAPGELRGVHVAADVLDAVDWVIKEGTCE